MFLIRRPSVQAIEYFIHNSVGLPLSYSPAGILTTETVGHALDETVVTIGRGKEDFERARCALRTWKQFDIGWVELFPPRASTEVGTVVAVLIRHFGFWSLNGSRVVYGVSGQVDDARFGFAYGTLTNHAEAGEELFEVFMNPRTEEVTYRILAVSWPRVTLTRVGYPLARMLQARFRRDSAEAMKRATSGIGLR
jgi:uncharacterized protein (UPF0548 family)